MYFTYMATRPTRRAAHASPTLRARDLVVLLVLSDGDLHGYGIMKEVSRQSGGSVRLEVGSLYRALDRLLEGGLIEETEAPAEGATLATDGERRRYYRLTPFGRQMAQAEAERLRAVLRLATAKGLIGARSETP
jgi:DNA-binding PadR family transcriptional regulator